MRKSTKIIVIAAVVAGVLLLGKNMLVKFAVEKGTQAAVGLPMKIKKCGLGIVTTRVVIKDLNLYNPQGFPREVMFHAPEIFVDYDLGAILTGKIHLKEVRLDFDRFVIVKNAEGQTNLEALKPEKSEKDAPRGEEGKEG